MPALQSALAHIPEASLLSHIAWYDTMQALTANKREALRAWRHRKVMAEKEKQAALTAEREAEANALYVDPSRDETTHAAEAQRRARIKQHLEEWKVSFFPFKKDNER